MRYLFDAAGAVLKRLHGRRILLLLDYDGTLTPIVKTPGKARLSWRAKQVLKKLARTGMVDIAVISGRSLHDVEKMTGIKGLIYAGNHGLEARGPGFTFVNAKAHRARALLKKIKRALEMSLGMIDGMFMEDKGLTLSVHYRQVRAKNDVAKIKNVATILIKPFAAQKRVCISSGKKVLEIKPQCRWNKGSIVHLLLHRHRGSNYVPFYFGDDTTDEDAFKMLRSNGIAVLVGAPKRSYARYYLRHNSEVTRFLEMVLKTIRIFSHDETDKS